MPATFDPFIPASGIVSERELIPIGMGIDKHAVLFRAHDRLLRAIHAPYSRFYAELIEDPVIGRLMAEGRLVSARRSQFHVPGHSLVLEHPVLPVVSYPFEWTPSMFRDAALALLDLNLNLLPRKLCTQDAHLWNVLFDRTQPVFVDFTSIVPAPDEGRWHMLQQFEQYCLNPLLLMNAGYPTTARALQREILSYPDPKLLDAMAIHRYPFRQFSYARRIWRATVQVVPRSIRRMLRPLVLEFRELMRDRRKQGADGLRELEMLRQGISELDVMPDSSQWSDYYEGRNELPVYQGDPDALSARGETTAKHRLVEQIIERLKPASVLDLGCNRGLYSQFAARTSARVLGIDTDEAALDLMYADSKRLGSGALPLYVNAAAPAEATGFKDIPFPTVTERLRSDGVLCLALVHHLVYRETRMKFPHIARMIASYARRWAIVEFVPEEDKHLQHFRTPDIDWYTLENFVEALRKEFRSIEHFESYPAPRVLLVCEK